MLYQGMDLNPVVIIGT